MSSLFTEPPSEGEDLLLFSTDDEDEEESRRPSEPVLFPNANFKVGMKQYEMNDLVSKKDFVVLKIIHNCYCYDEENYRHKVVYVVENRGIGIRVKDLIWEMVLSDYTPECKHNVLTMFAKDSDCIFRAIFHEEEENDDRYVYTYTCKQKK